MAIPVRAADTAFAVDIQRGQGCGWRACRQQRNAQALAKPGSQADGLESFLSADSKATVVMGVMGAWSTGIRFVQEGRSHRAAEGLRALRAKPCSVAVDGDDAGHHGHRPVAADVAAGGPLQAAGAAGGLLWLAVLVGYCLLTTLMKRLYIRMFGWQ